MNGAASGLRAYELVSLTWCGDGRDVHVSRDITLTSNEGSGVDSQVLNCSMSPNPSALFSVLPERTALLDRDFDVDFVAFFVIFFSITAGCVDTCASVDKHGCLSITSLGSAVHCTCFCLWVADLVWSRLTWAGAYRLYWAVVTSAWPQWPPAKRSFTTISVFLSSNICQDFRTFLTDNVARRSSSVLGSSITGWIPSAASLCRRYPRLIWEIFRIRVASISRCPYTGENNTEVPVPQGKLHCYEGRCCQTWLEPGRYRSGLNVAQLHEH